MTILVRVHSSDDLINPCPLKANERHSGRKAAILSGGNARPADYTGDLAVEIGGSAGVACAGTGRTTVSGRDADH